MTGLRNWIREGKVSDVFVEAGRHLLQGELQEGADEAAAHPGHQAEESGEVQFNVG